MIARRRRTNGTISTRRRFHLAGRIGLPAVLALALGVAVAGAFPFGAATSYEVGGDPASVAVGDVDGDGLPDLAVANNDDDSVSVLRGTGGGAYGPQATFGAGERPTSVTVAYLDGDTNLDLAVANWSGHVTVLLGDGAGGFVEAAGSPHATGADGAGAIWVTGGDTNGDGDADLVVANSNIGEVSILIGDGGGGFAAADNYPAGAYPESVVAGDFNGDQLLDLAVAHDVSPTGVAVLLNTGADSNGFRFSTDISYTAGLRPVALGTGDFDEDGNEDLAVANGFGSTDVSILLGDGHGAFAETVKLATGVTPISVSVADLDADGHVDLAVANYEGDADDVSVLRGNGDGTFQAAVAYDAAGDASSSIAAADLNADGAPDLAVANQDSATVSVLLGTPSTGADTTDPTIEITTPAGGAWFELGASATADFACADEAGGSGLASCVGTVADGDDLPTATVGRKAFQVDAEDNAGNDATLVNEYVVGYRVLGSFPRSFSRSTYRGGSTIPVKFRLGNALGQRIGDLEASTLVASCRVRLRLDGRFIPGCATYDSATDTFQQNVKLSSVLPDGQHTVSLEVTAPDGSVVNTDEATIAVF